jgi:O-antigen/teichoic acid export membrane protein
VKLQLARNAFSNLLGAVIPALVAIGTVPLVVRGLGDAGYGVYSLVTAIVGYFAVIDINVTAGSVKYIAEFNARDERDKISETLFFGLAVYAVLGLLGATGLYLGAELFATRVFAVPAQLVADTVATLKLAALGFFLGQLQAYLQSVPQALMRYDISSRIEMLFGAGVPLLTVAVLMLGHGLFEVILVRVAASALHCTILWLGIRRLLPGLAPRWVRPELKRALMGFSAYSFLSRFATLSYAYADRLIIGSLIGVTALAYFTVAATLASRILGISYRLSAVFFPAASALAAAGELARLDRIYLKASRYVVFINASVLVLLAVFADDILRYWMNAEFARNGAIVLSVMALSQFIDSLTSLPSLVNDGMGYPRTSGLFAVGRAVSGLLIVYAGVALAGIDGAAWGHLLGSSLFALLFIGWVHGRTVPTGLGRLLSHAYAPAIAGVLPLALLAIAGKHYAGRSPLDFALLLLLTMAALFAYGLLFVIEKDDKHQAWTRVKGLLSFRQG